MVAPRSWQSLRRFESNPSSLLFSTCLAPTASRASTCSDRRTTLITGIENFRPQFQHHLAKSTSSSSLNNCPVSAPSRDIDHPPRRKGLPNHHPPLPHF